MRTLRTIAALLTIVIGGVVVSIVAGMDYSHADGDGGFASPGLILALIFGGAPIVTGIEVLRRQRFNDPE